MVDSESEVVEEKPPENEQFNNQQQFNQQQNNQQQNKPKAARITAPPQWRMSMNYEEWRLAVELWNSLCDVKNIDPAERGYALYDQLCQHKDHNVVTKLISAIKNHEIDILSTNSVTLILNLLDKTFRKDDVSVMMKSWSDFINIKRREGEEMNSYLERCDQSNGDLKTSKITLPETVLALHMLERSSLDVNDKKLVMTGIKLDKSDSIVQDMANGMKKYFGVGIRESSSSSFSHSHKVKEEVYEAEGTFESQSSESQRSTDSDLSEVDEEAYHTQWRGKHKTQSWRKPDGYRNSSRNYRDQKGYDKSYRKDNYSYNYKKNRDYKNTDKKSSHKYNRKEYNPKTSEDKNKKYNPRMRCNKCESVMHLIKDCPHADKTEEACEAREVTESEAELAECNLVALLDSACSKNVVGEKWLEEFTSNLSNEDKELIRTTEAKTKYRFGGSEPIEASDSIRIPCIMAGKKTFLFADVVKRNIPFLISKQEMAKRRFKLDLGDSTVEVDGESVPLITTQSGLLGISLSDYAEVDIAEQCNMVRLDDTVANIIKLHKQLGHCSAVNLKRIAKNANVQGKDVNKVIDKVVKDCDACARFAKTPSTPIVGLPMATSFNEVLALDLKTFSGKGNVHVVYIIDMFSRLVRGKVIRNKQPKTIIDAITFEWIAAGFGPPKKILVDNGGEFANYELNDFSEQLNFEVCVTSAFSPWSNGLCEKNHAVVDKSVNKLMEDGYSLEIALIWAINAKNTLYNYSGFSPIQIVTGQNPYYPGVSYNLLPANETADHLTDSVQEHLNAMYLSRKAYLEAENSERIKRALKRPLRDVHQDFNLGDIVFYKRPNIERWKGPAKIVGKDGKTMFLRHGGQLIKAATCRIVKREYITNTNEGEGEEETLSQTQVEASELPIEEKQSDREDETIEMMMQQEPQPVAEHQMVHEPNLDQVIGNQQQIAEEPTSTHVAENEQSIIESTELDKEEVETKDVAKKSSLNVKKTILDKDKQISLALKYFETRLDAKDILVGDEVKYFKQGEDKVWEKATVTQRGKRPGRKDHWITIKNTLDEEKTVDCTKTAVYKIHDEDERDEVCNVVTIPVNRHGEEAVIKAKEVELVSWRKREVYDEVKDCGQSAINTMWVVSEKLTSDIGVKARLVVKGFQEECDQDIEVEAPTVFKSTLKVVLTMVAQHDWEITTIDIKSAFLQGNNIERNVYVIPPKEAGVGSDRLWRLRKTVYGLNDAARAWFNSVKDLLLRLGCTQSVLDAALFLWRVDGRLEGILVLHVDDFLIAGTKRFFNSVVKELTKNFEAGKICKSNFKYIGLNIEQKEDGIRIQQHQYIDELDDILHNEESELFNASTTRKLRTICGQLNWISGQSRPDLSFITYDINVTKNSDQENAVKKAGKAFKRMKEINQEYCIKFSKLGELSKLKIVLYSDAAVTNVGDKVSSGKGHIIMLANEQGGLSPLSWGSHKVRRVVSSSLAAETLALKDAMEHAIYLSHLVSEICFDQYDKAVIPIVAYTDNLSLEKALRSSKHVDDKRLIVDLATIRQMQKKDKTVVVWKEGAKQIADCFTKIKSNPKELLEILDRGTF